MPEDGKGLCLSLKGQVELEKREEMHRDVCFFLTSLIHPVLFLDTGPKSEPQAFTWLDIFIATKMSFPLAQSGWNPRSGIVLME